MKVRFLTPYNKFIEVEYSEILNFCKEIATANIFKDEFLEYKKHYNYFSAYFDYVMFRLGYIMENPLFFSNMYAIADNNQLYFFNNYGISDYDEVKEKLKNDYKNGYSFIPRITKCDDLTLQIAKQTTDVYRDVLTDPNMISMMSKSTIKESHVLTGNTILNQLLITSKKVCDDFLEFRLNEDNDAVDYLVSKMAFIRLISPEYAPLMIVNKRVSTLTQRMFFSKMEKDYDYELCDLDDPIKSQVAVYRKILKQTKEEI